MRLWIVISFTVMGMLSGIEAQAQLLFDPELEGETVFENTVVGEDARIFIAVTGNPQNDVQQIVLDSLEGDCFSVNPREFRIEGGQRVFITLTFSPEAEREYDGRLMVIASSPNGREFVYETELVGLGIGAPEPDIEVDPASVDIELTDDRLEADFVINVFNVGEAQLEVTCDAPEVDWLERDLARVSIAAGANRELPCHVGGIEVSGEYETALILRTNVRDRQVISVPIRVIADIHQDVERRVELRAGWNLISLNIDPGEDYLENGQVSMRLILEPIIDRVRIVKSGDGSFAMPSRDFWGLEEWTTREAYYIYVNMASVLTVTGEPIPPDRPIEIGVGWSYVAYYPNRTMWVDRAFASLVPEEGYNLVKNGRGQFWVLGAGNFGQWDVIPGQGYMVRLHEPMTLRYPPD